MVSTITRLPDGQTFSVKPIFSGFIFKNCELNLDSQGWPAGWTVVLQTEESDNSNRADRLEPSSLLKDGDRKERLKPKGDIRSFTNPTLENDQLFLSSLTNPSTSRFEPIASTSRQKAMMLWVTLYWYFHQPEPKQYLHCQKGWRVRILREGLLQCPYLLPKLERMGIITSTSTAVGTSLDSSAAGWESMFVSRNIFWQLPSRLFLFKLKPASPLVTTPLSPVASGHNMPATSFGPYYSTSHLPTYFPPVPLLFTTTNGIRHPVRPKPPHMGEIFYSRFIPSVDKYIAFRVASVSPVPVPYIGPVGPKSGDQYEPPCNLSDPALLQTQLSTKETKIDSQCVPDFLLDALSSEHSLPAMGLWDGTPFVYFEVFWVKEDEIGKSLEEEVDIWDRGLRVESMVESAWEELAAWITSFVHWSFTADLRTMNVFLEFGTDTDRFVD